MALHTFATWCHPIQRYRTMYVLIQRRCNIITPAQQMTIPSTKQHQHYTSVHLLRSTLLSSQSFPSFQPTSLSTISRLSPSYSSHLFLVLPPTTILFIHRALLYLISWTSSPRRYLPTFPPLFYNSTTTRIFRDHQHSRHPYPPMPPSFDSLFAWY